MRKVLCASLLIAILPTLTACEAKPVCPFIAEEARYLSPLDMEQITESAPVDTPSAAEVAISGRLMTVDKVVSGPLCNDTWKGTVYVTCDIQVFEWEEEPLFLKDCSLSIEPGTVVYVASHNDAPYYNGCSCHTGENP